MKNWMLPVILLLVTLSTAAAQVGIYRLDFKETGNTLNYHFYDGGYFVTDLPQGTGTFILTLEFNTRKYYVVTTDSGELFLSEDGSIRMASISAQGGVEGATSTLLASGSNFDSSDIGGGIRVPLVKNLSGYFLAFQPSGNPNPIISEEDPRVDGFAGFSKVSAKLDSSLTREVNNDLLSVSESVDFLVGYLSRQGFLEDPNVIEPEPEPEPDGENGDPATTTTVN